MEATLIKTDEVKLQNQDIFDCAYQISEDFLVVYRFNNKLYNIISLITYNSIGEIHYEGNCFLVTVL
jgi:hypothetical protein